MPLQARLPEIDNLQQRLEVVSTELAALQRSFQEAAAAATTRQKELQEAVASAEAKVSNRPLAIVFLLSLKSFRCSLLVPQQQVHILHADSVLHCEERT